MKVSCVSKERIVGLGVTIFRLPWDPKGCLKKSRKFVPGVEFRQGMAMTWVKSGIEDRRGGI